MNTTDGKFVFDGVICFGGEDWWYHNRGHYDMQMMREISTHFPVLYVNSIGMRTPKVGEGKMFFTRVIRKLKSFKRGLVNVRKNFSVFSPVTFPGLRGSRLAERLLAYSVVRAARKCGIMKPLVWVNCPTAAACLDYIKYEKLVYQRTDRYEDYEFVDHDFIKSCDLKLKDECDVTLFCSSLLFDQEKGACPHAEFIDHGVDFEHFYKAGASPVDPEDVKGIPHPRVGYVGDIESVTMDPPLLEKVVKALPDVQFVMVGKNSFGEGWGPFENVHFLGQKPYEQVAQYMASCDCLIMPWNQSPWIEACNPIKLKEYLAAGRPVVTTSFYELKNYEGLVENVAGADAFAAAIRRVLEQEHNPSPGIECVRNRTWTAQANKVLEFLKS